MDSPSVVGTDMVLNINEVAMRCTSMYRASSSGEMVEFLKASRKNDRYDQFKLGAYLDSSVTSESPRVPGPMTQAKPRRITQGNKIRNKINDLVPQGM